MRAWDRLLEAEPPAWVLGHCRCVAGLAAAMADCALHAGLEADRDLVVQGALLHDIGRSVTQDIHHAHIGAEMLAGWDARIVRIVERHTGAGIDAAEAAKLGLPVKDYTPQTLEERIVAHADNLFSGDKRLTLDQVVGKYEARGLEEAGKKIARLHDALSAALGVDLDALASEPWTTRG